MARARRRLTLLAGVLLASGRTQATGPAYLDEPSRIVPVGHARPGERLPLAIVLPATGASAADVYGAFAPHLGLDAYVAMIPDGVPAREDYSDDFDAYVRHYERRLEQDLARARAQNAINDGRVFVVGFSLGGDLAWALLARHPDWFRGALILSSGCSARLSPAAAATLRRRGARVVFAVGDHDPRRSGLARAQKKILDARAATHLFTFHGGHQLPPDPAVLDAAFRELFAASPTSKEPSDASRR